jgi:hypothetical protein
MHRSKLSFLWTSSFALALTLGACGGDDGGGDENNDDDTTNGTQTATDTDTATATQTATDTDTATATQTATDTDTATQTATDTDTATATDTDASTTDPDTGSTDDTAGTTAGVGVCDPEDDDDDCAMCTKDMCCDELEACIDVDANCGCVLDCLAPMEDPGIPEATQCSMDCGANFEMIAPSLIAIQGCQAGMCAKPCG